MLWYVALVHAMYLSLYNLCAITQCLRHMGLSDVFVCLLSVCLQLAFCTGEYQMAAAPVPAAEGSIARGQRSGPRPQACPGALLRRLGPYSSDSCFVQTAAGPILPHYWGTDKYF